MLIDIKSLFFLLSTLLTLISPLLYLTYQQASQNQLASQGFSLLAIPTFFILLTYSLVRCQGDFFLIHQHRSWRFYGLTLLLFAYMIALISMIMGLSINGFDDVMDEKRLYVWIFVLFSFLLPIFYLLIHLVYQIQEKHLIDYPLSLLFLALPLEPILRNYDLILQRIGAQWAVSLLNFLKLFPWAIDYELRFINDYTFRSDRFYLIINESCSGVNLLLSNLIFVIALGYFFQITRLRWLFLIFVSIPLSMFFNACRIATIFWMGHFHGVTLAMGPWHDRVAYITTLALALSLILIDLLISRRFPTHHTQ